MSKILQPIAVPSSYLRSHFLADRLCQLSQAPHAQMLVLQAQISKFSRADVRQLAAASRVILSGGRHPQ